MLKNKNKEKPQKEKGYFNEVADWEIDRIFQANKSKNVAWFVSFFCLLIALSSILAVSFLTPLKTVEPLIVRVDNNTGIVDVTSSLKEYQSNYEEAINKYFIAKYIINRESYNFDSKNYNYEVTGKMSNSNVARGYFEWIDPSLNPDSPFNLTQTGKITIQIKNISFLSEKVALVPFSKTIEQSREKKTSHWLATISFDYSEQKRSATDMLINPLGFTVTNYRVDPETL